MCVNTAWSKALHDHYQAVPEIIFQAKAWIVTQPMNRLIYVCVLYCFAPVPTQSSTASGCQRGDGSSAPPGEVCISSTWSGDSGDEKKGESGGPQQKCDTVWQLNVTAERTRRDVFMLKKCLRILVCLFVLFPSSFLEEKFIPALL